MTRNSPAAVPIAAPAKKPATDDPDGHPVVWTKEPHSKGWDRFMLNVMKAVPMEIEL